MDQDKRQEGLWRNCSDSITHALEHFSEGADDFHNRKWALLSVAHAAEAYCNLLLCSFDPSHPRHPRGRYPSLDEARELVSLRPELNGSESYVLSEVLEPLARQRNELMHMPAPDVFTFSDTAIALLALLHIIRVRTTLDSKEFFDQHPPIETNVFEEVSVADHAKWTAIAERLAKAEYEQFLEGCDNCGAYAVPLHMPCQACFSDSHGRRS